MDRSSPRLPFDEGPDAMTRRDELARRIATDPRRNVVLEASAGTGKTTVLVNRYLNLLKAGIDPTNILAITFTRKAAAEMRQRIVRELQRASVLSPADAARWHDLRDRLGDIGISTIDAFCLSLLREFPLEADLDPGFDIADETLIARIKQDALDRTVRVCRRLAASDESVRVLLALLGEARLARALDRLLDRRLVARRVLDRFVGRRSPSAADACAKVAARLEGLLNGVPGGLERFLQDGPCRDAAFDIVARDLTCVARAGRLRSAIPPAGDLGAFRAALDSVRGYFVTQAGEPRKRVASRFGRAFDSPEAARRHAAAFAQIAPGVHDALAALDAELNRVLAAGVRRAFAIAGFQFRRRLDADGVLDFSELLARALALLGRMDEFSQSRYRLESRYHHVLVDEFQDTSRAQWRLVSLLVRSWGEGAGLAGGVLPPSIFVVGDRKQSIYGFRDADAAILGVARRDIQALRPGGRVRRSIARSFRAMPALLSFANDLFASIEPGRRFDRFHYGRRDAFPVGEGGPDGDRRLGLIVGATIESCASGVADEVSRLLREGAVVRDPRLGTSRAVMPGDIAILFRSREGHQQYEQALAARGVSAYVYKGLGFFDADETKDLLVLVDYLARPDSDLAAAALLRSRIVRLSDAGLQRLAPRIAAALAGASAPEAAARLDAGDLRAFAEARRSVAAWLPLVDRLTPAEVIDRVLEQCAYAYELRGARRPQARENLKKMRALVRKIQNRGYTTMADVAEHLRVLSAGDESNAVIDAVDAVNLMTVHAAKGLEFPVVFLVNLSKGSGGGRDPIRVIRERGGGAVSVGEFTSDADTEAPERELEETKRLLYVAVTRARDRLYFCSSLKKSRFTPHARSLGWVLPASFAALFSRAPDGERAIARWQGPSGCAHDIVIYPVAEPADGAIPATVPPDGCAGRLASGPQCAARTGDPLAATSAAAPAAVSIDPVQSSIVDAADGFAPLVSVEIPRVAATTFVERTSSPPASSAPSADDRGAQAEGDQPVLGLMVHRLLQYSRPEDVEASRDTLARRLQSLLTAQDRSVLDAARTSGGTSKADLVIARAVDAFRATLSDARLHPLLGGHRWLHEVPFSMAGDGMVVRGVIDLLVVGEASVTVVEVKTGAPRPEHARQLDVYRAAAEQLFPGRAAHAVLVYAGR